MILTKKERFINGFMNGAAISEIFIEYSVGKSYSIEEYNLFIKNSERVGNPFAVGYYSARSAHKRGLIATMEKDIREALAKEVV
jgi:hypothetical protein